MTRSIDHWELQWQIDAAHAKSIDWLAQLLLEVQRAQT